MGVFERNLEIKIVNIGRAYGSSFVVSINLDGLKSIPTICFEPMALSCESSVGTICIVATDFNPLDIELTRI